MNLSGCIPYRSPQKLSMFLFAFLQTTCYKYIKTLANLHLNKTASLHLTNHLYLTLLSKTLLRHIYYLVPNISILGETNKKTNTIKQKSFWPNRHWKSFTIVVTFIPLMCLFFAKSKHNSGALRMTIRLMQYQATAMDSTQQKNKGIAQS